MLYFHPKLPDPARGTNSKHLGNVFVFMWAYKMKIHMFREYFLSFTVSKITEKGELTKTLATGETSAILCRRYNNCLDVAIYTSEPSN